MSVYSDYTNYIKSILDSNDINLFKSNTVYNTILEHVSNEQGLEYLKLILGEFNLDINKIIEFSYINDSIGQPVLYDYHLFKCSPSSLRYIYHTCLILNYIKKLNIKSINIVEIGGGYGGLCLCISYFSKYFDINIENYNIIDIDIVTKLIKKYLNNFNLNFNIELHNANTYGQNIKKKDLFMISNYCYSEIDYEERIKYKEISFPKVSNGFLVWNDFNLEVIKDTQQVKIERPLTGSYNKFIYL